MPYRSTSRVVAAARDGRTWLRELRSEVPVSLRPTWSDGLGAAVTMVASGFWPLGGDEATVEAVVEAGASLTVGTAGAQVAQPGPVDPLSHQHVRLDVARGGHLTWRPQPLVVTTAAEHRLWLDVSLAAGSSLLLVDTVVLRGPEPLGRYGSRWRVAYDGVPLLAADLDIGTGAPDGWDGPAVLGGAGVVVTALVVGDQLPEEGPLRGGGEVLHLAGPAALVSWLGSEVADAPLQNGRALIEPATHPR